MPESRTIVIALILIISGAALRFHYYFFLGQYMLKALLALSVVIFVTFVLLLERRSQTHKDLLAFAVVVAILWGLAYESAAGNKRKNQKYLQRLSSIVNCYIEKNHRIPNSFDEAFADSGEMLPNRGDADGNPYMYIRISDRIYLLRSFGSNRKNDFGSADDVVLNYLNGNYVSSKELSNWIESNGTPEEKNMLEPFTSRLSLETLEGA